MKVFREFVGLDLGGDILASLAQVSRLDVRDFALYNCTMEFEISSDSRPAVLWSLLIKLTREVVDTRSVDSDSIDKQAAASSGLKG